MARIINIGLVILVVMAAFYETNAQICTACLSGGYCSCSYPQCCIVYGQKMCCRLVYSRTAVQLNKDTQTMSSKALGSADSEQRSNVGPSVDQPKPKTA